MTTIYVDATTLISLGEVDELGRLCAFDGELVVLPSVSHEVTTEPANTRVQQFVETDAISVECPADASHDERARDILGDTGINGDVRIVAAILVHLDRGEDVVVISDDTRVRTVARGFGAEVTGTIGVIVRAVEEGLPPDDAIHLVRRIDGNGLHMTAELRETTENLIREAATCPTAC